MPPASYSLRIEAAGFKTLTVAGLTLSAGQQARLTNSLELGQVTESVKVDSRAATVVVADSVPNAPLAQLQPVSTASPGQDLQITARITAPAGLKWARLRYRHMTQYEDYRTADMTLDPASGLYKANIPASFIDFKWNLMYFVEVVDRAGAGRIYPDLEKETP